MNAELETRRDVGEGACRALPARQAVGDDSNVVAALGLAIGEIKDMTKNAANRRAHHMQNTQSFVRRYHESRPRRLAGEASRSLLIEASAASQRQTTARAPRIGRIL